MTPPAPIAPLSKEAIRAHLKIAAARDREAEALKRGLIELYNDPECRRLWHDADTKAVPVRKRKRGEVQA